MRNVEAWTPSKFVVEGGRLRGSSDRRYVSAGSRLACDATAGAYDRHLGANCRGRLLDLGCGKVPLFQAYRDYASEIWCADWPHSAHWNGHLDLGCDLSAALPFKPSTFDTIVLSDVLEHLFDTALIWREISRVLRPSGKVLLSVPFYYGLHEVPHDYYRCTRYALERHAKTVGLGVVVLEEYGGVPEILGDLLAKQALRRGKYGVHLADIVQRCVSWFVGTSKGRRFSQGTARGFPFGYFMVATKA